MRKIKKFGEFNESVNQLGESIDIYDEMDKKIPIADETMRTVAKFLVDNGYKIKSLEDITYDTDGLIDLGYFIGVVVTIDGEIYVNTETATGFKMSPATRDLKKVLKDIEEAKNDKERGEYKTGK